MSIYFQAVFSHEVIMQSVLNAPWKPSVPYVKPTSQWDPKKIEKTVVRNNLPPDRSVISCLDRNWDKAANMKDNCPVRFSPRRPTVYESLDKISLVFLDISDSPSQRYWLHHAWLPRAGHEIAYSDWMPQSILLIILNFFLLLWYVVVSPILSLLRYSWPYRAALVSTEKKNYTPLCTVITRCWTVDLPTSSTRDQVW